MNPTYTAFDVFDVEPTFTDLAAIAAEAPVIAAEVAVVDAECRLAMSHDEMAVKAHRRAVVALGIAMRTAVETSTNRAMSTAPVFVPGVPLSTARRVVIRPAIRTA
ncbi:DUF6284 family protein [Promicromonospora panici]|uniref:DUF6284 family protein n=1 Tax=Promicromonospora panici TaxID=2219658 RepID=UPI00101C4AF3|nr:DUF6284 family protein [Promicromonospora panici]